MSLVAAFILILTAFAPTTIAVGPVLSKLAPAAPEAAPATPHENVVLKGLMADADKDGIEDGVDAKASATPEALVTIHLLYGRRPTDADVAWLGIHMPVERSYLFHNVDRVKVETAAGSVPLFLSAPGVVAIQEFVPPVMHNNIGGKAIRAVADATNADGLNHAEAAHAAGYKGQGMVVAVLDTGVDQRHPYVNDMDFHDGTDAPKQVMGVTVEDGFVVKCIDPLDDNGHGSHVAGTSVGTGGAVGETNGFPGLPGTLTASTAGVNMGAAPGARYVDVDIAVNAVYTAVGTGEDLAFDWIIDYNNGVATCAEAIDTVADRIDVATMSFGAGGSDPTTARAILITAAVRSGITTTLSAGNDGANGAGVNTLGTGAEGAIIVAADDDRDTVGRGDDRIAGYSSRGKRPSDGDADTLDELRPDIAAPGSNIVSTNYLYTKEPLAPPSASMSGTSMATPFVAGVAALILQANPDLRPVDSGSWQSMGAVDAVPVRDILQQTATSKSATEGAAPQFAQPGKFGKAWNNAWGYGLIDAYAAIRLAEDLGNVVDSDGDGVSDANDRCPGSDDRLDVDGDLTPDGCDSNNDDGPLGDLDGDGVNNAADECPGIDDASPECTPVTSASTFYLGRGPLSSPSGNLDVVWGDATFLQLAMTMDPGAPEFTDPAVLLAPGLDSTVAHDALTEPGEWSSTEPVALKDADVEVVWWGVQPANGFAFYEEWDVQLYIDGASAPVAEVLNQQFTGVLDGVTPTEYRVTLSGVTGTGILSVVLDPSAYTNQQDFLILYDSIDYPSRLIITQESTEGDADGDGVPDESDACPGFNDLADLDGDGTPDGCDLDRDGDGVDNASDAFPNDASEWADADADGTGDNSDQCPGGDDGDDLDGDGMPDACDGDRDGDGVANASDAFPDDASESTDSDADGVGDNSDACPGFDDAQDADNDGTPDGCEAQAGLAITSPAAGATIDGEAPLAVAGTFVPADDGDDEQCTDCNGDGFVVVAVVDTGINPYNPDFAAAAGQPADHPSTYISGYPASAPALDLQCTATTAIPTACASDFAAVQQNKLYWIPGTKIIGAISTDKAGADFAPTPILDNNGHGTGSASVAVGNQLGTCAQCLMVAVEGFNVDWAYKQPWIDIVSNSWGRKANAGGAVLEADNVVFGSAAELDRTRAFTEDGGTSLWAAGNGAENAFVVPISTYTAPYTGADWHYVVGAVITGNDGQDQNQAGEQSIVGSGKPVTVSSYGSGAIPASCYNSLQLNCAHSGTSSATPITAGAMATVLLKAKQMLGTSAEGPQGAGVAAKGNAVAGNQYLEDGELSRQELWALVSKTARNQDSGWISVPVTAGHTGTPVDYAMTGYGIVNRWSRDDAVATLALGADLPDRSDVDAFMAQDSAIRQALWGEWSQGKFEGAPVPTANGVTQANALPRLEAATADLGSALRGPTEGDDDGTVPGTWGEIGDVKVSNTGTHLQLRLELTGALDGTVPTVLGNPFTYQVSLVSPHNVAGQQYRATYTFDAATTTGAVLTDSFAFNVLTAVDGQGLASLCPIATDLSTSTFDIDTGEVVWNIPLTAFDQDNKPTRAEGCVFTRNGDDLAAGDVLSGILGESTVKVATVSVGGMGDSSPAPAYTLTSGEPPACEDGDHIVVALADATACVPFDGATQSTWATSIATGLDPGAYLLTATAYDDGAVVASAVIPVHVASLDADGDGIADDVDNCPAVANDQADLDGDGAGDACDADRDGDGVDNALDAFPDDASESADSDGDGVGDNADAFPNDPTETVDSDGDGAGDNADAFPNDANESADSDGDGVGDNADAFPNDASETTDTDGDGVGDNSDAFPTDGSEWVDSDADGTGDNADACPGHDDGADLDGDGVPDGCDTDRDGDGYSNDQETSQGSNPDDAGSIPDNPWTTDRCTQWHEDHPGNAGGPPACRQD